MPEERRETNTKSSSGSTQKATPVEKTQAKTSSAPARTTSVVNNSAPTNGGVSDASGDEKKPNRVRSESKEAPPKLANGSVTESDAQKGAASLSSSPSSSSSAEILSSSLATSNTDQSSPETSVQTKSAESPSPVSREAETVEPNNNHIRTTGDNESRNREERPAQVKEVSPAKSITESRSKTSTPQDQKPIQWDANFACYKTSRRACRSKSINGSPASYHTSLMGPAQPSMYTQSYPSTAHYYALYASSQSVPIACQRHDSSLQQFAYRHHATGAMNGEAREERLSTTNLFVRPLLETDTKETLIALVAQAVIGGEKAVKSARVTHDRKQHSYGFIDFYQEENARKALEFLSKDLTIRQTRPGLEVKYARDSEKDDKNVYLSGVPTDFTDKDQLLQLFQSYGAIDSVHIMTNSSGDPTGVAFVRFNSTEDAERAIDAVKNGDVLINGKSVDAKFADRHSAEDKRRRRRQNISTAAIYQNGAAAGLTTPTGLVNGYGSMTPAHHGIPSASPQPHLNMVIPSYHIRYYPTPSGPTPFLSSSAPSSAALSSAHSHFVPLHPSAAAAYQLSGAGSASQYPTTAAALLGPGPTQTAGQAAAAISAAAALNAAAAGYHHPALSGITSNGSHATTAQQFINAQDQAAALNAYQYYTAAMNSAGGYPVTENGTGAAVPVSSAAAAAAYFQPAAAQ